MAERDEPGADQAPIRCDVLVVGGGINGVGIARDLAGRGWRVVLCEQDDLASHTSSASTKLIHGGLRYLEHYEFGLVRKALQEREVLLRSAPHIMRSLRFVMPHDPAMRPAWMIRAGLFLYDHLATRQWLPASEGVDLRRHPAGAPLKPEFTRGFAYSDGWVDDARLVVLCALDAAERGATILTRTRCLSARRGADGWLATLHNPAGLAIEVQARALVNAAGPWAESFLRERARPQGGESLATRHLRLVKGSHIVVPRLFEHDHAYIFQNPDRRIFFAVPYEGRFTLIGTTDVEWRGSPADVAIEPSEIDYLCAHASRYFRRAVLPQHVVWHYAGVRPLIEDAAGDPSAVTRDYLLESRSDGAPLLTVWGGKLTTFRKLAEDAADDLGDLLGEARAPWTRHALLPGGDLSEWLDEARLEYPQPPEEDLAAYLAELRRRLPWLGLPLARRYVHTYGSRVRRVLDGLASQADLGAEIAPGLHEVELHYLRRVEWAATAEDVLWRRTKLGLHYTPEQRQQVVAWFARHETSQAKEAFRTSWDARHASR